MNIIVLVLSVEMVGSKSTRKTVRTKHLNVGVKSKTFGRQSVLGERDRETGGLGDKETRRQGDRK